MATKKVSAKKKSTTAKPKSSKKTGSTKSKKPGKTSSSRSRKKETEVSSGLDRGSKLRPVVVSAPVVTPAPEKPVEKKHEKLADEIKSPPKESVKSPSKEESHTKPSRSAAPTKTKENKLPGLTPITKSKPPEKKESPQPTREVGDLPVPTSSVGTTSATETLVAKTIEFNEMMTVKDLAESMNVKVVDVIKKLLTLGTPATINQRLGKDQASLVAEAFNCQIELKSIYTDDIMEIHDKEADLQHRPPVVTVMGHVDHGKTSLLDAIRSARVVEKESGGITQHIGAYQVQLEKGVITFLDTPGHEAFTAMRARGATATDIVILVVAADDSVMPQTIEAIDHARAANVPMVVAINKVDLPGANVQKVKQELAQHEIMAEDWGGKTVMVEVSAKTKQNIDKLLEMVLLEAELLELKANPNRSAKGVVLEAKLDPRRGITSTVLVQTGTLRIGDVVVCGLNSGRIRAMTNEHGEQLKEAGPSTPVEILGINHVPEVGDQLSVVNNDREAREISERRRRHVQESAKGQGQHLSLESLHSKIEEGKIQDLPVILKADVQGSLQAIQDALAKLTSSFIQLRFVHLAVGNINESDVLLAEAADAIIFGFHVKTELKAESEAKKAGVDIRSYQIIYEMLADIRAAMEGLLKPMEVESIKGRAEVKQVFSSSRFGSVAGCMVLEGPIVRGQKARVLRNNEEVGKGSIGSLRRFKEDVKELDKGFECGIALEGFKYFKVGDLIEFFVIEKKARRLEG